MIQDLHSHTYYSFCGADAPEEVVNAAVSGGVELLGICDHNYGIALQRPGTVFADEECRVKDYQRAVDSYLDHMRLVSERYRDQLTILCGIEIATENQPHLILPDGVDISKFDYCLIEHIDSKNTSVSDLFEFAGRCGCGRVGIAHTDIFGFLQSTGKDARAFFRQMAEHKIFWEMNVSYDSIHKYREHEYVKSFLASPEQQEIVRESGAEISVGFDGHRVYDYRPDRVRDCCSKLEQLQIKQPFAEEK